MKWRYLFFLLIFGSVVCSCNQEIDGIRPEDNSTVEFNFANVTLEGMIIAGGNNDAEPPVIKIPYQNCTGALVEIKDVLMPEDLSVESMIQLPFASEGTMEIPIWNKTKIEDYGDKVIEFEVIHLCDTNTVQLDINLYKPLATVLDMENISVPLLPQGEELTDVAITIPMECVRSAIIEVACSGLPSGISYASSVNVAPGDTELRIPLSGMTTGDTEEQVEIALTLTINDNLSKETLLEKTFMASVIKLIKITDIEITGGLIAESDTDDLSIKVNYKNGVIGKELSVSSLDGFAQLNGTAIGQVLETEEGAVTFVVKPNQLADSPISEDTKYPSEQAIIVSLQYEGADVNLSESINNKTVMIDGFIWKNKFYRVLSLGNGQQWLDRNLGAISNKVATPELDVNTGRVSSWEHDFRTYGDYYQRGRKTGIPIQDNSQYPFLFDNSQDRWEQGYWSTPSADISPAKPSADNNTFIKWEFGGENFPAPIGFDVPDENQMIEMVEYVNQSVETEGNLLSKLIMSELRFPLSGAIQTSGPSGSTLTSGVIGQTGIVGTVGNINLAKPDDPSNTIDTETLAANGQIWILTKSIDMSATNAGYIRCLRMLTSTTNTTTMMFSCNRTMSMPIRCIKRQ